MLSGVAACRGRWLASTVAATAATTSSALIAVDRCGYRRINFCSDIGATRTCCRKQSQSEHPGQTQTKPRPQSATTIHNAIQAQGASNGT